MKTLPKLSEYILKFREKINGGYSEHLEYCNFITQPLNLSHFVPAIEKDGKWIVYESYFTYKSENNTICIPYEGLFEIKANEKCRGWKYLNEKQEHKEDQRYYDSVPYEKAKKTIPNSIRQRCF